MEDHHYNHNIIHHSKVKIMKYNTFHFQDNLDSHLYLMHFNKDFIQQISKYIHYQKLNMIDNFQLYILNQHIEYHNLNIYFFPIPIHKTYHFLIKHMKLNLIKNNNKSNLNLMINQNLNMIMILYHKIQDLLINYNHSLIFQEVILNFYIYINEWIVNNSIILLSHSHQYVHTI